MASAEFDWRPGAQAYVTLRLEEKRDAFRFPNRHGLSAMGGKSFT